MMRRQIAAACVIGALSTLGMARSTAEPPPQAAGFALAALSPSGDPFSGFVGPWRGTETGFDVHLTVLCVETVSRRKIARSTDVSIPDGTSPTAANGLIVTGIVEVCAADGITVARTSTIIPSFQRG